MWSDFKREFNYDKLRRVNARRFEDRLHVIFNWVLAGKSICKNEFFETDRVRWRNVNSFVEVIAERYIKQNKFTFITK